MVLIGTIGNPRTGKTLIDSIIMIKLIRKAESLNKKLGVDAFYFSNHRYYLEYKDKIKYLNEPSDMLNIKLPNLYSGITELDELWTWLEARGSGSSSINKILSHVAFQSGKSGYDILWSAQLSSSVDKRIRLLTDYFLVALTPTPYNFRYAFVSSSRIQRFKLPKTRAINWYPYYDTRERIMPIDLEQELKLKNKDSPDNAVDSVEETALKIKQEDNELSKEDSEQLTLNDFNIITKKEEEENQRLETLEVIPFNV